MATPISIPGTTAKANGHAIWKKNQSSQEIDSNSGGSGENSPVNSSGRSTPISTSYFGRSHMNGGTIATTPTSRSGPPSPATKKRLMRIRKLSEMSQRCDNLHTIPTELSEINKDWARLVINQHRIKNFLPPYEPTATFKSFEVDNCKKSSGDLSTTCRMKATISSKSGEHDYVFIAKLLPADDPCRVYVFEANVFEKEISIYFELMPCLRQMCADTRLQNFMDHHIPQCIYASNNGDGAGVLVFECVEQKGFLHPADPKGLSLDQVMCAVDALAKFHAAGSALILKKGKALRLRYPYLSSNVYSSEMMYEGAKQMFTTYDKFLQSFSDECDLHETFHRQYKDGVAPADQMFRCLRRQVESPFNTIIHGEAWEKNLLFRDLKSPEGEVKSECIILDWKNAKIASATKDLAFLLMSSVSDSLRREHTTTILKEYYKQFRNHLTMLGVDLEQCTDMSWDDFYEDYCVSTLGAFLQSVCVLVQELQYMERQPSTDLALLSIYEQRALNLMRDDILNRTHFT